MAMDWAASFHPRYPLPMHIVIVGCGRVGAALTVELSKAGHSVAVIDKRSDAFDRLPPGFHARTLVGTGFDRELLEQAGIREAGAFVAVTNGDNSNIVCARIAKEYYEVPRVAARIYDPRRAQIYERLGIPTVATVAWTTDQVLAKVLPAADSMEWTIGSGEVVVVGIPVPASLLGRPLSELEVPGKIRISALTRFGQTLIPDGKSIGQEGDFVHLSVLRPALPELEEQLAKGAH
jgi:trk system potassium uptake protein